MLAAAPITRLRTLLPPAALIAVLALPAAAEAGTRNVCTQLRSCTQVVGPHVAVEPQLNNNTQYTQQCPGDGIAIGFDYRSSNPLIIVGISGFGASPLPLVNGAVTSFAQNLSGSAGTFQPIAGCVPESEIFPDGAPAPAPGRTALRTRTVFVGPSRVRRYSQGCASGERLLRAAQGLGFSGRRPSRSTLRGVDVDLARVAGRVRVRVATGPQVGDDEVVRLQIHALCARGAAVTG